MLPRTVDFFQVSLFWIRCIQGLVEFIQPILDYTADGTGWFFSLMGGGPEPAQGGALSIIRYAGCYLLFEAASHVQWLSMHSGRTSGDVKLNFGRSEQAKFRQLVVPMYGRFLRQSFCEYAFFLASFSKVL